MVEAISLERINEISAEFPKPEEKAVQSNGSRIDVQAYLSKYGWEVVKVKPHGSSTLYCLKHCIFDKSHNGNESAIGQANDGKLFYQCFHDSCRDKTWKDARMKISGNNSMADFMDGYDHGIRGDREESQTGDLEIEEIWDEPIDVFSDILTIKPTWKPIFAPAVITELGYDFAERMGVRPEQIIGPAIINIAGVTDDKFRLQPKEYDDSWNESARLNGIVVGPSGAIKSPAKQKADFPVKKIQSEMRERYREKLEVYNALDKKEQKETSPPVFQRIICGDITIEGLRDILQEDGGARKIICSVDELSGFFGSFDSYRASGKVAKDRPAYMELYEGGSKIFDRAGKINIYVPNWSACICGTITPENMVSFFGKLNTDGLLQRFLLYKAERLERGIDRTPESRFIERYESTIGDLVRHIPERVTVFKLSVEAQEVWQEFERLVEIAMHLPNATGAFKSHLNKYSGMFCRLALTYYMAELISTGQTPDKNQRVSGKIAAMAARSLLDYHMPVAREFYHTLGYGNISGSVEGKVCSYILSEKLDKIATRDVTINIKGVKDKYQCYPIFEKLEHYNWVKPFKYVKLTPTQWKVNPAVHKIFRKQAEIETKRKTKEKAKIALAVETYRQNVDNVACAREEGK